MEKIKTFARKWGDSIAIIIPSEVVRERKIKPADEINIIIEKRTDMSDLFGKWKRKSKKSTQEIKDEARKGWESNFDREMEKRWKSKEKK